MSNKNTNNEKIEKTSMVGGLVINGLKKITPLELEELASAKNIHPDIPKDIASKLPELYANVSPKTLAYRIIAIMIGEISVTKMKMELEQRHNNLLKQNSTLENSYQEYRDKTNNSWKELQYYKNCTEEWKQMCYKFKRTGQILAIIANIAVIATIILTILLCL